MPKKYDISAPPGSIIDYPVKAGPGDVRYVKAKVGANGAVKILPPQRVKTAAPVNEPLTNSTLPNPRALERTAQTISRQHVLNFAKPGAPEPYVYGYTAVRPLVIGADDSGEFLVVDYLLSVGEIESIDNDLYMPDIGAVDITPGSPLLYEHFTGTAGQAASTIMTALKGSYAAYANKAHSVISMQPGWNLNVLFFAHGRKVIDPRNSPQTRIYSANPALMMADALALCGYTFTSSGWDSVAEAADYCDELVGSPGKKRWTIGGVWYDRTGLRDAVLSMSQYAHAFVHREGTTVWLVPDKPRSSSHTVTADDIVDDRSARLKYRGHRSQVDGVRVVFKSYIERTFEAEYGTLTDPGRVSQLNMPLWADFNCANRHAEEVQRKSQNPIEYFSFVGRDATLKLTIGDVGTVTYAPRGLSSQLMTLVENEQIAPGRWRRTYEPYNASDYQDSTYTTTENSESLSNPYAPPTPAPTLNWTYNAASPQQPILTLTWPGVTWAYVKDYDVWVYSETSPQVSLYDSNVDGYIPHTGAGDTHTIDLSDTLVSFGTTYTVEIAVRSIRDALSATPGTDSVTPTLPKAFDNLNDGAYLVRTPDSPWPFAFGDTAFTVSGWFQVPPDFSSPQGVQAAIIIGAFGGDALSSPEDPICGWQVATSFTGRVNFSIRNQGVSARVATTSAFIEPDTWYHYIAEHDPDANTITVTIDNGAVTDTETTLGRHPDTVARDLQVAYVNSGYVSSPELFQMRVDDTGIWNRLLTSGEKTELWNSGAGINYDSLSSGIKSGLIAWWGFNETSGDRLDLHGSYDLSLVAPSPQSGDYTIDGKVS